MALDVAVDLKKEFSVDADPEAVFALLADVPRSASHFPKVERLTDLGGNAFRWEMQKIGVDKYALQTIYACQYQSDEKARRIWWTPVAGEGNSVVEGEWRLAPSGAGTVVKFQARGVMTLPLPRLAKVVVAPIVRKEFEGMVDTYIRNLKATLNR